MSLKQFLSNTQSGTDSFYSISASLVYRLSKWPADPHGSASPRVGLREFLGFHEFEPSKTNYVACLGTLLQRISRTSADPVALRASAYSACFPRNLKVSFEKCLCLGLSLV